MTDTAWPDHFTFAEGVKFDIYMLWDHYTGTIYELTRSQLLDLKLDITKWFSNIKRVRQNQHSTGKMKEKCAEDIPMQNCLVQDSVVQEGSSKEPAKIHFGFQDSLSEWWNISEESGQGSCLNLTNLEFDFANLPQIALPDESNCKIPGIIGMYTVIVITL